MSSGEHNKSLEEVKDLAEIDTDNDNPRILQFINDGFTYLNEQKEIFGFDVNITPTDRERQPMEQFAAAKWLSWRRPEKTGIKLTSVKEEIKTHIRAVASKHSDDGIAGGANQFRKVSANVRDGFGI